MKYTIYKTTNKINSRYYIGFHITDDPNDDYLGSGKILKQAISKYGESFFSKEVLHIFETPEEMFAKEAELVNEETLNDPLCYNLKLGGQGGWDHIKINGFLGKTHSVEYRKKLSKRNRLLFDSEYYQKIGRMAKNRNHFAGKHHSDETKRRIGEANKKLIGDRNGSFGTMWITNGIDNRKIKKDFPIPEGWYKGRK